MSAVVGEFGVVVLSYGDGPARVCVDGLVESGLEPRKILVVHNPSHAGEEPPPMPAEVATQVMPANLGYGPAMNEGMRYWRRRDRSFALLCTHDVEVTTQAAIGLVNIVAGPTAVAVSGPVLRRPNDAVISAGGRVGRCGDVGHLGPSNASPVDVDWLDGSVIAVDLAVGIEFAEDFFLYWEDVAFGIDLRAAGYRVVCHQGISAISRPGTGGTRAQLFTYLSWRNRLGFAVRRRSYFMAGCTVAKLLAALSRRLVFDDLAWSRRRVLRVYLLALVQGLTLKLGRPAAAMLRGSDAR